MTRNRKQIDEPVINGEITPPHSRRSFFRNLFRMAIAMGLGVVSASLLLKESTGGRCTYNFVCSRCRMQTTCNEPEADAFRASVRSKNQSNPKTPWEKSRKKSR